MGQDATSVLVVEDDRDLREILTEVLENEGCRVTAVANGAEALALLRNGSRPDLILVDLWMPVLDGLQFRRKQRGLRGAAEIPTVLLSADGDGVRAVRELFNEALVKPLELSAVLALVQRHLTRSRRRPVVTGGS
ncbi:MAG: response regulator [Myxococcota bacterium]